MVLKNSEMKKMVEGLIPLLKHRDKVGYVAARNVRIMNDSLTEYSKMEQDLIRKYGTSDMDDDGNELPTISLSFNDPNFKRFSKDLEQFGSIEHDVTLMKLKYEEAIGLLSGEEILANDWMFED